MRCLLVLVPLAHSLLKYQCSCKCQILEEILLQRKCLPGSDSGESLLSFLTFVPSSYQGYLNFSSYLFLKSIYEILAKPFINDVRVWKHVWFLNLWYKGSWNQRCKRRHTLKKSCRAGLISKAMYTNLGFPRHVKVVQRTRAPARGWLRMKTWQSPQWLFLLLDELAIPSKWLTGPWMLSRSTDPCRRYHSH